MSASYVSLLGSGELARRVESLSGLDSPCLLCPRACRADRKSGERGYCGGGAMASLVSCGPHHGEEGCISGIRGSGTLFLGHCNLKCLFCQNADISQNGVAARGREVEDERVSETMLRLQRMGCHNINWVSPTHQLGALARALLLAAREGLRIPVVYNTNGYDSVRTLRLLDGVVDIYMPDLKYSDESIGLRLSNAADYVARSREAVAEMHRQVGDLVTDGEGVAVRGLLIRHLVLPENLSGTADTLTWIAETLGRGVTVNLMSQYHPAHDAAKDPRLTRGLAREEYECAMEYARGLGLRSVITQPRFSWMV